MLRWFLSLSSILLIVIMITAGVMLAIAHDPTPIPVYIANTVDPTASMSETTIYLQTATTGERFNLYQRRGWFDASLAPHSPHALLWNHDAMYMELTNLRTGAAHSIADVAYLPQYIYPSWSAAGDALLFTAQTYSAQNNGIQDQFMLVRDVQHTVDITPTVQGLLADLSGDTIIYTALTDGKYTLYQLNTATGESMRLSAPNHAEYNPSISPDGTQVVFTSQRDLYDKLYLLDLTTGEETYLMEDPSVGFGSTAVWSPDGRYIAYSARLSGAHPRSIYLIDTHNREITTLVDAPSDDSRSLHWSADGEWLAFRADWEGSGIGGYMLHLPTGDALPLAASPQRGVRFAGFLGW